MFQCDFRKDVLPGNSEPFDTFTKLDCTEIALFKNWKCKKSTYSVCTRMALSSIITSSLHLSLYVRERPITTSLTQMRGKWEMEQFTGNRSLLRLHLKTVLIQYCSILDWLPKWIKNFEYLYLPDQILLSRWYYWSGIELNSFSEGLKLVSIEEKIIFRLSLHR